MSAYTYEVTGLNELLARFDQLAPIFEQEVGLAMVEAVRDMETGLAMTMPMGDREPHMRSSMEGAVEFGVRVTGIVTIRTMWASWVDKGTKPHDIPEPGGIVVHHPGAKPARFVAQARNLEVGPIMHEFEDAMIRITERLDH